MDQNRLSDALARCREETLGWEPVYDDFIARLQSLSVGEGAPRPGEPFPDFALPNSLGRTVRLADLLAEGPLVLSFNRGGWCPYCRTELALWSDLHAELQRLNARFVAVSAEVGGRAEQLRREVRLDGEMLCDVDHGLALELGLAFFMGSDLRRRYLDCGLDLTEIYGAPSGLLPVPATFVIDPAGMVRFAHVEPDFRLRAEPVEVLATVAEVSAEPVT